jgi:hypothetical protein
MRDTDIGWATKIVAVSGGPVATLTDLRNRTLALGSRDSGHAAILPVHFLEREGLVGQRDYRTFNSDVGKHGDTGASEVEVARRPRGSRRCRRDRQPVLGESAKRAFGAGGGAARDLDFAAL